MLLFAGRQEGQTWQPCNKQCTVQTLSSNFVKFRLAKISTDKHQLCQIWWEGQASIARRVAIWRVRGYLLATSLHCQMCSSTLATIPSPMAWSNSWYTGCYGILRVLPIWGLGLSWTTLPRMQPRLTVCYSNRARIRRNTNIDGFNTVTHCRVTGMGLSNAPGASIVSVTTWDQPTKIDDVTFKRQ